MIDFNKRLESLKERRQGSKEIRYFEAFDSIQKSNFKVSKEKFEDINEKSGVKYAIGAMAEVDKGYTQNSINEGNRVANTLSSKLHELGQPVEIRLQGSVALNIHIKGYSDVDMLILDASSVLAEKPLYLPGSYSPSSDSRSVEAILKSLRSDAESILSKTYYASNVNISGDKSISISGGSLQRKVDIVPAFWHDRIDYQKSKNEVDRGVLIYNKSKHSLIENQPFKHAFRIDRKDVDCGGNLKSIVRLLKNIIADMPDDRAKRAKGLSSYDLTSIVYHMDSLLVAPSYMQLSLVENTRNFFSYLISDSAIRNSIRVPDGSRVIFDQGNKLEALQVLAQELKDLAFEIQRELSPYAYEYDGNILKNKSVHY